MVKKAQTGRGAAPKRGAPGGGVYGKKAAPKGNKMSDTDKAARILYGAASKTKDPTLKKNLKAGAVGAQNRRNKKTGGGKV